MKRILNFLLIFSALLIGFGVGNWLNIFEKKPSSPPYTYNVTLPADPSNNGSAFSQIVKLVSPSVVNIFTTKTVTREESFPFSHFFDYPFDEMFGGMEIPDRWKEQSLGSGVVVSPDGYIITNSHVVEKADEIRVKLFDKRDFKATLIGSDPKTDIAVIKISAEGLPAIKWGDSDKLEVGEFVLAFGNPYSFGHTVTMGIVSAVGRANVGIADYEDFIQTDAAINPGNSGGPLVNIRGELIGINTAIFSRTGGYQGIGFAVPSNMARAVMRQLIEKGKVI
jgi:serine protease Do